MAVTLTKMSDVNLVPNSDYDNQNSRVEVFHNGKQEWYPLVRTASKVLFYEDEEGNVRKMTLKTLGDVNFVDGLENTYPVSKVKEEATPEKNPIVNGGSILTNTNYEGHGFQVLHRDKGWFELLGTSNKVLYYKNKEGKKTRLTMMKFGGYKTNSEEIQWDEQGNPMDMTTYEDEFQMDNFFDMVG